MAVDSPSLAPVHIGTSGWHYKHWKGPFYPSDLASTKWLSWYVDHFDTVEINNSFYRLPATSAMELWCQQTPANFDVTTITAGDSQIADHYEGGSGAGTNRPTGAKSLRLKILPLNC